MSQVEVSERKNWAKSISGVVIALILTGMPDPAMSLVSQLLMLPMLRQVLFSHDLLKPMQGTNPKILFFLAYSNVISKKLELPLDMLVMEAVVPQLRGVVEGLADSLEPEDIFNGDLIKINEKEE